MCRLTASSLFECSWETSFAIAKQAFTKNETTQQNPLNERMKPRINDEGFNFGNNRSDQNVRKLPK